MAGIEPHAWTALLLFASCFPPGLCSESLSVAAGLCDGLLGLFQGFLLPPHCSPSSCGPSQPPPACPSLCCVLSPWGLWLGSMTQAGSLCSCLFGARGLLPTGILSAGQSFPTCSLHFSEARSVLMERCSRISLMVNKAFLHFPLIFISLFTGQCCAFT